MALPVKLNCMVDFPVGDLNVRQLSAISKCYGRLTDDSLAVLMPLCEIDNFIDESFKVDFASLLKKVFLVNRVTYAPWSELAIVALAASSYNFSQISRAVISNSNLFWGDGFVKLVCKEDVFNLALGAGVKKEINDSVSQLCSGMQPVLNIQCKKEIRVK